MNGQQDMSKQSEYYEPYKGFASSLRAWFIAYGIGAPILFLSNDSTRAAISNYEYNHALVLLFLSGVLLQAVEALLYKHAMWHLYMGEEKDSYKNSTLYKLSDKISEAYLLGVFFDIATVIVYGVGTWLAYNALL